MDGGDGGLELEGTDRAVGERPLHQLNALVDASAVPQGPVLHGERNQ